MKVLSFICLVFYTSRILACSCSYKSLNEKIISSDFIAKVEILKISPNEQKSNLRELEINILELFKGVKTTKLNIFWSENTSCRYTTYENSTWLIFANKGTLNYEFGYCSGSKDLNGWYDSNTEPIDFELDIFKYLKKSNLKIDLSNNLSLSIPFVDIENIDKSIIDKDRYCTLYELTIDKNARVKSIKSIYGTKNTTVELTLARCAQESFKMHNLSETKNERKILVRLFYRPYKKYKKLIYDCFYY